MYMNENEPNELNNYYEGDLENLQLLLPTEAEIALYGIVRAVEE
jgi:hypothetical protein